MKIGELAVASATQVVTIRFYEREGLLAAPDRTAGNYRIYGEAHVQRLVFIRRCRGLDMALDEIRILLRFIDTPAEDCGDVNQVLDEHIGHVVTRIQELQVLEAELRDLRARCPFGGPGRACGILQELVQPRQDGGTNRLPKDMRAHVGAVHGRRVGSKP